MMFPQFSRQQQQSFKKCQQHNSNRSILQPNMKISNVTTICSIYFVLIALTTATSSVNANTMFCRCSNPRKLEDSNIFNDKSNNSHRTLSDNRILFDREHDTTEEDDDDDVDINDMNDDHDDNSKSIFTRAALESVSGPIIDSLKPNLSYDVVDGVTILPFNHAACKRGIRRPSKSKPQRRRRVRVQQQSLSSSSRRTQKVVDTIKSSSSSGIQLETEVPGAHRRDSIISSNATVMMMNTASNMKLKFSKLFVEFENETETTFINATNSMKLKLNQLFKTTTKNDTSIVLNSPKNDSTTNYVGGYVKSIWDLFATTKENNTNIVSLQQNKYTTTDSNTTNKLGKNPIAAALHQNGYSISDSNTRIDVNDFDKVVPKAVHNTFSVSTSSMAKLKTSQTDSDSFMAKLKFMKDRRQASNYINWDEKRYELRKKILEMKTQQSENRINIFLAKLKSMNVVVDDIAVTQQKKKLRNRFKQDIANLGPRPTTPLRTLRPVPIGGSPMTRTPRTAQPIRPTTVPDDDDDNYNNDIGTFICPPDVKVTGRPITTRSTSMPTKRPKTRKPRKRPTRKPRIPTKTPITTRKPKTSKPVTIPTLVPSKMLSDVPSGPNPYNSQSPNTVASDVPSLSPETINNIDSAVPTMIPSATSTIVPSVNQTTNSLIPSVGASSVKPSVISSDSPSTAPSFQSPGSDRPSTAPTIVGSDDSPQSSSSIQPQSSSSDAPSVAPMFSQQPTRPTQLTDIPSPTSSVRPTTLSNIPTIFDSSNIPSSVPAGSSSSQPTSLDNTPVLTPSINPTVQKASDAPSGVRSDIPTIMASNVPIDGLSKTPSSTSLSQVPSVTDVSNIPSTIPQTQSQNPTTTGVQSPALSNIPTRTSILSDIPTSVGSGVPVSTSSIPSSASLSTAPSSTNLSSIPSSVPITTQSQNPTKTFESDIPSPVPSNIPIPTVLSSFVPISGSNSPSSADLSKSPTSLNLSNLPSSTPDQGSVAPVPGSNNPTSTDSSNAPTTVDISNIPSSTPDQGSFAPVPGSNIPSTTDLSKAPTSLDLSTIPSFVPSKRDVSQVPYISSSPSKTDISQVPYASSSPIASSVVPSVSPIGSNVPSDSPVLVNITLAPTNAVSSLTLEPSIRDLSITPSKTPSSDSQSESPSSAPSYTGPFSGIRYPTSSPVPSWPLAKIPTRATRAPTGIASIRPSMGSSASLKPTSSTLFPTRTLVPIITPTVSNSDNPSILSSDFPSTSPNMLIPTSIQSNPVAPTNRLLLKETSTDNSNISEAFDVTHSISSSSNRAVVVVGLYKDSQRRRNSGMLRFYHWNDMKYELIKNVVGQPDDILGHQVAVCSDGSTVVAAASSSIHIYQVDSKGNWIETQRLVQKSRLHFVSNLVLSTDCTKLAVSEYNTYDRKSNNGKVRVYSRINNMWGKLGSEIHVDAVAGAEILLTITATGAMLAVATAVTRGMTVVTVVLVFELKEKNQWEQLGDEISILNIWSITNSPGIVLTKLALNDGRNLAVSSNVGHGQVKIYVLIDDAWTIQDVIKGTNIQGWFGASIKFTEENDILHVGVVNDRSSYSISDGSLQEVDSTYIYKKLSDKWIQNLKKSEISNFGEVASVATNDG